MADNVTLPATGSGTTTPVIATDDVAGIQYQEVKLDGGGNGATIPIIAGQQTMANSLPIVVASNQTAVPISAASLPLPTGAATAANQPSLGTAGTPSSNVITVQGITSMRPLLVDGSGTPLPVSGTGTFAVQSTLQAGTALVGQVSASNETNTLYAGTTGLTPKWATIAASTSGANSLVSAVASHKIRVVALALMSNGTVNVKFQSHTTPTDLTGLFYLIANTGFVLPYNPLGWFQTVSGEQLDINLSASIAVGGVLQYVEVP